EGGLATCDRFCFSGGRRRTRFDCDWSSDVCSSDLIERVACESAEDLASDGVVYAEVRYAPIFSTARGLTLQQVMDSATRGFAREIGRASWRERADVMAGEAGPESLPGHNSAGEVPH